MGWFDDDVKIQSATSKIAQVTAYIMKICVDPWNKMRDKYICNIKSKSRNGKGFIHTLSQLPEHFTVDKVPGEQRTGKYITKPSHLERIERIQESQSNDCLKDVRWAAKNVTIINSCIMMVRTATKYVIRLTQLCTRGWQNDIYWRKE